MTAPTIKQIEVISQAGQTTHTRTGKRESVTALIALFHDFKKNRLTAIWVRGIFYLSSTPTNTCAPTSRECRCHRVTESCCLHIEKTGEIIISRSFFFSKTKLRDPLKNKQICFDPFLWEPLSGIAEKWVYFFRRDMANHTQIPHSLLDWLCGTKLTGPEYAVALIAIRRIYGWSKIPKKQISVSLFQRISHRDRASIRAAIESLKNKGLLVLEREAINGKGRIWGLNPTPPVCETRHTDYAPTLGGNSQHGELGVNPDHIKRKEKKKIGFKESEKNKSGEVLPITERAPKF